MPATYQIDPERALVIFRFWGALDLALIAKISEEALADPQWRASYDRVWDGRDITGLVMSLNDVKGLVFNIEQSMEHEPRVAMVGRRETDLVIGRLIKAFMRRRPIEVFKDYDEALRWLSEARTRAADPNA